MQFILESENFRTRRLGFRMKPHPRGHGPELIDTHSVLEVQIDGRWQLFDPTCNVTFPRLALANLAQSPELARSTLATYMPDDRFQERQYALYCTDWAFSRVFEVFEEEPAWLVQLKGSRFGRRWWARRQALKAQHQP